MVGVQLVDDAEFTLDGSMVRVQTISGSHKIEQAIPIATFDRLLRRASKVIAEWHARRVEPVAIRRRKRRG